MVGDSMGESGFDVLTMAAVEDKSGSSSRTELEDSLGVCFDLFRKCIDRNASILVCCSDGISISPTIVMAWVIQHHHASLIIAWETVRASRLSSMSTKPNIGFFTVLGNHEKRVLQLTEASLTRRDYSALDTCGTHSEATWPAPPSSSSSSVSGGAKDPPGRPSKPPRGTGDGQDGERDGGANNTNGAKAKELMGIG